MKKIFIFVSLFFICSCTGSQPEAKNTSVAATTDVEASTPNRAKPVQLQSIDIQIQNGGDILKRINLLNAYKSCDHSSDCALLAIGHRACGGPESYQVYSKSNPQLTKLTNLVAEYKQFRIEKDKENHTMGTCQILEPPQFSCIKNQCQLASGVAI